MTVCPTETASPGLSPGSGKASRPRQQQRPVVPARGTCRGPGYARKRHPFWLSPDGGSATVWPQVGIGAGQ